MFHLIPGQALRHRGWNDEFVVYNDLSGDTHLLGADAMQLLLLLKAGPQDERALQSAIFPPDSDSDPHAQRDAVRSVLHTLRAIALIEER